MRIEYITKIQKHQELIQKCFTVARHLQCAFRVYRPFQIVYICSVHSEIVYICSVNSEIVYICYHCRSEFSDRHMSTDTSSPPLVRSSPSVISQHKPIIIDYSQTFQCIRKCLQVVCILLFILILKISTLIIYHTFLYNWTVPHATW